MSDSSRRQMRARSSSNSRQLSPPKAQSRRRPSRRPSRHPSFPPPPSVEDEITSLAREYPAPAASCLSEDEPPCKGTVDQTPVLVEVHEHNEQNPERRFVIVKDEPKPLQVPTKTPRDEDVSTRSRNSSISENKTPKPTVSITQEHRQNRKRSEPKCNRERSPSPRTLPPLSPLNTDLPTKRSPEHHRSRSSTSESRPDYFTRRQPQLLGDQLLLSPDIIHSGVSGLDRVYRGTSNFSNIGSISPTRETYSTNYNHGRRRTGSTAGRSDSGLDIASSYRRRLSNDWANGPRNNMPYSFYSDIRDKAYTEDDVSRNRMSEKSSRDQSRSSDYKSRGPEYYSSHSSKTPIIIQDGRRTVPGLDKTDEAVSRNGAHGPRTSPSISPFLDQDPLFTFSSSRGSATYPVAGDRRYMDALRSPLPYPDDGVSPTKGLKSHGPEAQHTAAVSMPPFFMPESPTEMYSEMKQSTSSTADTFEVHRPVHPQRLDASQKDSQSSRPVGAVRRYSESHGQDGQAALPECHRKKPVVGLIDWLTLPRTNLNICPTCYENVFAKSGFGSHFQPMIRATDQAISCDFGSCTWYRIAWLLTLKHDKPDLSLLYQAYYVASSPRFEPCPGAQKATRNWLTVRDPCTNFPVPAFAVCCECARIVEALLPGMNGVLVPLDASREKSRNICAFHLTPNPEQFVLYFDIFETTSDKAVLNNRAADVDELAHGLKRLTMGEECREDCPVLDGLWHTMRYLPELTVCSVCFEEVVRPMVEEGNSIALNFYMKPKRLSSTTCQLYSTRMREVFQKACRRRDLGYLETRVLERRKVEADIYDKLLRLDRAQRNDVWAETKVEKLVEQWKRWE